jgi:hypothetical protein
VGGLAVKVLPVKVKVSKESDFGSMVDRFPIDVQDQLDQ